VVRASCRQLTKTDRSTLRRLPSRPDGNGLTTYHVHATAQTTHWRSSGKDVTAVTRGTMTNGESRQNGGLLGTLLAPEAITVSMTSTATIGSSRMSLLLVSMLIWAVKYKQRNQQDIWFPVLANRTLVFWLSGPIGKLVVRFCVSRIYRVARPGRIAHRYGWQRHHSHVRMSRIMSRSFSYTWTGKWMVKLRMSVQVACEPRTIYVILR